MVEIQARLGSDGDKDREKGWKLALLACLASLLALGSSSCSTALSAPLHQNHTLLDANVTVGELDFAFQALGDVSGTREMIVWIRITNHGDGNETLNLGQLEAEIDDPGDLGGLGGLDGLGGFRTGPAYTCWSEVAGEEGCQDFSRIRWRHLSRQLAPGSVSRCWVVYKLPKYVFDSLKTVRLLIPGSGTGVVLDVSPRRMPEDLSMITITLPKNGTTPASLWSLRFQVVDTDEHPRHINWSVLIDGEDFVEGRGVRQDFCPIYVDVDLRTPRMGGIVAGTHRILVRVWDGFIMDSASVTVDVLGVYVPEAHVEWVVNTSDVFGGESLFGPGFMGCQTVWDVDGDGVREVVFGTRRGVSKRLWCFDGFGRFEWVYPSMDLAGLPGDPASKVSLVDVDGDGVCEICLAGRGGRLHVIDGDGRLVWYWDEPLGQDMLGAPQALDVDGDGLVEFFLNAAGGRLHRVSHEGVLVWSSFLTGGSYGHPTICDLDQDGEYEVLWASKDGFVYCVGAGDGSLEWVFDVGAGMVWSNVIVADLDADGGYEALVWCDPPWFDPRVSSVVCLSSVGGEVWRWEHPREGASIRLCQAVGDLDGDGGLDMVVMSDDGGFAIDISGDRPLTLWEVNFSDLSARGLVPPGAVASSDSSYQIIGDVDGDGGLEVMWLVPFLVVLDAGTGELEAWYSDRYVEVGMRADNGGWFGDIDQDGFSEYVCELRGGGWGTTRVVCLTLMGRFPAESPWPEYYHTAYPAEYQWEQDWLTLKSAGSNSLWFPIGEPRIPYLLCCLLCSCLIYLLGRCLGVLCSFPVAGCSG